jgi:hypothetical protein
MKGGQPSLRHFIAILFFIALGASAQTPPEPDIFDIFYALPKDDSAKLVPLERQQITVHSKASGFMVVGMKASSEIAGGQSPVRFKAGEQLEFIVRSPFAAAAVDPNTFYGLRSLHAKKNKREIVFMTGHASPVGGSTKTDLSEGSLPVEFSKYGASSYKLTTPPLKPGEYALGRATMPQTVFCFGVD